MNAASSDQDSAMRAISEAASLDQGSVPRALETDSIKASIIRDGNDSNLDLQSQDQPHQSPK